MNGWPTQAEIDVALATGIMLNVCRCVPYPGESSKTRIARGMSIAAPYIRRTMADFEAEMHRRAIANIYRVDYHRYIAEGMSRSGQRVQP